MKVKDPKTGQETEVFTQAEVDAKAKERTEKALEEFKAANPDRSKEVEKLQSDLVTKEKELADAVNAGDKDGQVLRLRQERDEAKRIADEAMSGLDKKLDDFRKEITGDTKEELLSKLSKGDADLKKKIEYEFDRYLPNANTKKDVEERIAKAYLLATGTKPIPGILDGITGSGDRGNGSYKPTGKKEWNQNEIAIGNTLGITDEDRKAYEESKGKK